jgi:hypothetical protein
MASAWERRKAAQVTVVATHGQYQHSAFAPQVHGDFDPSKHGDFDESWHGRYDPALHGVN